MGESSFGQAASRIPRSSFPTHSPGMYLTVFGVGLVGSLWGTANMIRVRLLAPEGGSTQD